MCSTRGVDVGIGDDGRPVGALPRGYARGEGVEPRPVWVDLSGTHPAPDSSEEFGGQQRPDVDGPPAPGGVPAGGHGRLRLTGEVRGRLHHWERLTTGAWFGVVDYSIPLLADFRPAKHVTLGLVPAAALRPRDPRTHDLAGGEAQ